MTVEEWLKLLIQEQYNGGPQFLPSEATKPVKSSSWTTTTKPSPAIQSYFDAKQFSQLCAKTVSVKLAANSKASKSNKKYFQDPQHELALFLVVDGRSICNTCVCVIGCYNIPEPYRSCEEYLFRAVTHPQIPESHDFDEWLQPLVDELTHLSLKGFKAKDDKGVLRTYKAHLVTVTDDLFDRTMLLCSHLPKSKTDAFCSYCMAQRKLRPGQEYTTHKRRGRYADEDAHEISEMEEFRAHSGSCCEGTDHNSLKSSPDQHHQNSHSHANSHRNDNERIINEHSDVEIDDEDEEDEDDDLVDDCDCQQGYYEPLLRTGPVSKFRKNMPWTPYCRCIFERLGSMASPHSLIPDIAHICHHVMDDMYWLLHLMCLSNSGDSGELAWDYKWPSRHPKVGPMVVDSTAGPDGVPVEFSAFYAKYGCDRPLALEKQNFKQDNNNSASMVNPPHFTHSKLAAAIAVFIHLMTELLQEKFSFDQLNSIETFLRQTKFFIYDAIKLNPQWGPVEFFHYPMHLVDHLVECIRQTGPLVPTMTLHLLPISDRTNPSKHFTNADPKRIISYHNEFRLMAARRISMASIPRRQEIHSGYKNKSKRFKTDCQRIFDRAAKWIAQQPTGPGLDYTNLRIFQTRSLPENALDMQNLRSYLWDGEPHLVRLTPATHLRQADCVQEYALLAGFFRVNVSGKTLRQALVQKLRDPTQLTGFQSIDVPVNGVISKKTSTMTIGFAVDLVAAFEQHLTVVPLASVVEEYELSHIVGNCYSICMRDKLYSDDGDLLLLGPQAEPLSPGSLSPIEYARVHA